MHMVLNVRHKIQMQRLAWLYISVLEFRYYPFNPIYHVSVDHQHNLDHTDFKVILFVHVLSSWSNGRSLYLKEIVFVVPGSNPV